MNARTSVRRWELIILAFVLSGVMLAYEILLTRIASVLLTSQYIFLVIGVSLLGISVGAILEYSLGRRSNLIQPGLPALGLTAAVVLALSIFLILKVGANSGVMVLALSAALPFGVTGFVFARLFRLYTSLTGLLYAADLLGAAVGALAVPLLLPSLGPIQAVFLLALFLAVAATLLTLRGNVRWMLFGLSETVLIALLFFFNSGNALLGDVPIGRNLDKDLYRLTTMQEESVTTVESRWSTFGRTDLVRFGSDTSTMAIFIDGAAGTNMIRFNGSFDDFSVSRGHAVHDFGGLVPLSNLADDQKNSALVIGPGGGRDVLLALKVGFKHITAVDINPQMVAIVKDYRAFNGGIYTDYKNVSVVVAEGRNYLRHSRRQYDLITMFMPITKSSQSLNSFALSESYLFTKEAFKDYYDHLTEKGLLLVMAHSIPEVVKLLTTAVSALQEKGLNEQQAMKRLFILGSEMMPLFGLKKSEIVPAESDFLHSASHFEMFDSQYSFIPGIEQQTVPPPLSKSIDAGVPMMNPIFLELSKGSLSLKQLEVGTGMNLIPATDDQPFFFQYDFSLPPILFTVLWLSAGLLGAVLLVPARRFQIRLYAEGKRFSWWIPLFFTAIGFGYIVIELSLFQKIVFYLGDPSRSLALLLAAILVGSGVGSLLSRNAGRKTAILCGLIAAGLALITLAVVPMLFSALHNATPGVQQSVAAMVLFIQGIPMGVMFPIGLRIAEKHFGNAAVPWMWAINGSASVAGSALAIIIAMSFGYRWSLLFGVSCYAAAALTIYFLTEKIEGVHP
ncbi:hypothetical protein KKG19_05185 [Patescibacteria group bacterium]|nr:hypothetical protein [Patescibacteria group bacterium]